jgi:transposase-like protein
MTQTRRKFTPEFKTKVVLEALSERLSLKELAQKHELHPTQIAQWKREFLDKASEVFSKGEKAQKTEQDYQQESEELYKTIGQLKVEVDWLKKNCSRKITLGTTLHV